MTQKSTLEEIRALNSETYTDVAGQLVYAVVGVLLPFGFAWLLRAIKTATWPPPGEFARAGEFALYSTAVLTSAAYLLGHDYRKRPFPGRLWWSLVCLLLGGIAILCYMVVAPEVIEGKVPVLANPAFYAHVTMGLFLASSAFLTVISIIDATRGNPDVRSVDDQQVNDLVRRTNDLPS